jgi:hypothetical protein
MVGSGDAGEVHAPDERVAATSAPKLSASATASTGCSSSMPSRARILAISTSGSPGFPSTAVSSPSGFSSPSSGKRLMVAMAASPSSPTCALTRSSTIGPRIRLSSGSSQALLPRLCSVPAMRGLRRITICETAPSTPRCERAATFTSTVSPCSAPPSASGGRYTSSASPSRCTKPNPRGLAEKVPSNSSRRDAARSFSASRKRCPAWGTTVPSKTRSSITRDSAPARRGGTPRREAISLMWSARFSELKSSTRSARRGGLSTVIFAPRTTGPRTC